MILLPAYLFTVGLTLGTDFFGRIVVPVLLTTLTFLDTLDRLCSFKLSNLQAARGPQTSFYVAHTFFVICAGFYKRTKHVPKTHVSFHPEKCPAQRFVPQLFRICNFHNEKTSRSYVQYFVLKFSAKYIETRTKKNAAKLGKNVESVIFLAQSFFISWRHI